MSDSRLRRIVVGATIVGGLVWAGSVVAATPPRPADGRVSGQSELSRRTFAFRGPAIAAEELLSVHASRRLLAKLRAEAAPKSCRYRDIDFVIRLADRYLIAGMPVGRRMTISRTVRINAWWYSHRTTAAKRGLTVRDPQGVLATYWECRGFAVNPVATTGRWLGMNNDVTPIQLAKVLLPMGSIRTVSGIRYRAWEYYDIPERPGVIKPGTSGMAQGRVARIFATAYTTTGDRRYLDATTDALRAFTVSVRLGGVRSLVSYPAGSTPSPWFVERAFPGANPWRGAALNGFMAAILNLNGTASELRKPPPGGGIDPDATKARLLAENLAAQGASSVRRYLPLHDSGSWSYYGMLPSGHPWRTYLAPFNYHCYHVSLLRQMEQRYPGQGFGAWHAKWSRYVARRGKVCPII